MREHGILQDAKRAVRGHGVGKSTPAQRSMLRRCSAEEILGCVVSGSRKRAIRDHIGRPHWTTSSSTINNKEIRQRLIKGHGTVILKKTSHPTRKASCYAQRFFIPDALLRFASRISVRFSAPFQLADLKPYRRIDAINIEEQHACQDTAGQISRSFDAATGLHTIFKFQHEDFGDVPTERRTIRAPVAKLKLCFK